MVLATTSSIANKPITIRPDARPSYPLKIKNTTSTIKSTENSNNNILSNYNDQTQPKPVSPRRLKDPVHRLNILHQQISEYKRYSKTYRKNYTTSANSQKSDQSSATRSLSTVNPTPVKNHLNAKKLSKSPYRSGSVLQQQINQQHQNRSVTTSKASQPTLSYAEVVTASKAFVGIETVNKTAEKSSIIIFQSKKFRKRTLFRKELIFAGPRRDQISSGRFRNTINPTL